jgi:hypothetical protein
MQAKQQQSSHAALHAMQGLQQRAAAALTFIALKTVLIMRSN